MDITPPTPYHPRRMKPHAKHPIPSARRMACAVLNDVLVGDADLDTALAKQIVSAAPDRERAFARALVMAVLRRHAALSACVDVCLQKPLPERAAPVRVILLLGAAQILCMDTPAHAAVNETVSLVGTGKLQPFRGLVNAVLQRLTREKDAMQVRMQTVSTLPAWLAEALTKDYGAEICAAIEAAHQVEPPLDITVRENADAWANALEGTILPTGTLRLAEHKGRVDGLHGFADGSWWVQDAAAAIPARLLGDVAGKTVLDVCAAPGGKTSQLCATGARVTALDISAPRMARLKENMKRLGFAPDYVVGGALDYTPPTPFDAVLLDAPCSATGTARRQPDMLLRRNVNDTHRLQHTQRALLRHAAGLVKPGGMLVYCVCSLLKSEGEEQADWFMEHVPGWRVAPVTAAETGLPAECITPAGYVRTLPLHFAEYGGMDGFFMARFIKGS